MEPNQVEGRRWTILRRTATVGIPLTFRMVEWTLVIGVMRYLGDHFNLQAPYAVALVLSVLMLTHIAILAASSTQGRSRNLAIALTALFLLIGFALIALAWELASVIATLQAEVLV